MLTISLIHPSRQRPQKAFGTCQQWLGAASGKYDVQYLISLDSDDPQLPEYKKLFGHYILYPNTSVVEATNHAAKFANGEILIYMSDDFVAPPMWDKLVVEKFGDKINDPALVRVDDCLQKISAEVLTCPIMTKSLYKTQGYFWHPAYKSQWVDVDLFHVCRNNGWLILAPEIKFEHQHYCNGKAVKDETYTRSDANWQQGLAVFNKRKALNFPI